MGEGAGRVVVLGVAGGIAAYKAVEICRHLCDDGLHVVPVLTADAQRFVGAVTFSALASEPARTSVWEDRSPIPHTELGQRAEVIVVAPATADLIGRYAAGTAGDLLTATLLASRAPVVVCPAMHTEMWEHPAVQDNLATLQRRGVTVVPPEAGRLAGGDVGAGRLASTDEVVAAVHRALEPGGDGKGRAPDPLRTGSGRDLAGIRVLVTAGGTREPIDPVRYLTNRSSGRQGHAVAEAAARRGAAVHLVTASPLPLAPDVAGGVTSTEVETAAQMAEAVRREASADVVVMAAAVADFRPAAASGKKLHRDRGVPELVLEPTEDILSGLVERRRPGQVLVGFAAETGSPLERGREKLHRKGVDLLVVNDVSAPGAGFDHPTNAVTILTVGGEAREVPLTSKHQVADMLLDTVVRRLGDVRQQEREPHPS